MSELGSATFQLNAKTQRWFLGGGIGFLPVLAVGMVMVKALPPPAENLSAARVADLYGHDHVVIQIGCVILAVGFAFWALWGSVITLWIWRMESRRYPLLTITSAILMGCQVTL